MGRSKGATMKLVFCPLCYDIVSLRRKIRTCACGKSAGVYVDSSRAVISGEAIPIGIANSSFGSALFKPSYILDR